MHQSNKEVVKSGFIAAAIIIALLSFIVLKQYMMEKVERHIVTTSSYDVSRLPEGITVSRQSPPSLTVSEIVDIRTMLVNERFQELNQRLAACQRRFEQDPSQEYPLYDAYRAFYAPEPSLEANLQMWMEATPDAYQPYLAAAQYHLSMGWKSRGAKSRRETSDEQIEAMNRHFARAKELCETVLKANPRSMIAYDILISVHNAKGENSSEDWMIRRASELFPRSFLIKASALWAKQPRWGGSYEQMERLARDAERYADENPRMFLLYGFIYCDQARRIRQTDGPEKALDLINKALDYGDHWSFYHERAMIHHYGLKAYDKALEDLNRSLALRPTLHGNYLLRSKVHFAQANYEDALTDTRTAEALRPGSSHVEQWTTWASNNLMNRGHGVYRNDLGTACEYYDFSLAFHDANWEAHYWRGMAFFGLKDYESALPDFQKAIETNPHHFESYRMIDYIYARQRSWETIIGYWDRFLVLEPDHADAYFERSGTHYHNRDMESAMSDLKKACELGHKDACKQYRKVRS